jgi:hypothetical protein
MQWHLEVQRELNSKMLLSVAYVGSNNGRLPYSGLGNTARVASPAGTPAATIDTLRPMPWVAANLNYTLSTGYSNYNALQTRFERRFANGLHTLASYTWSKSIDVSSGYFNVENGPGGGSTLQNFFDQNSGRGVSAYDVTHFFSWATVYEFPAGRGKRWLRSGPASWFLGNWQANYIFQTRSGAPYNLQITGDLANIKGGAPGNNPETTFGRTLLPILSKPVLLQRIRIPIARRRFRKAAGRRIRFIPRQAGLTRVRLAFRMERSETSTQRVPWTACGESGFLDVQEFSGSRGMEPSAKVRSFQHPEYPKLGYPIGTRG